MSIISFLGFNKFWKKFVFVDFWLRWKMQVRVDGLQPLTIWIWGFKCGCQVRWLVTSNSFDFDFENFKIWIIDYFIFKVFIKINFEWVNKILISKLFCFKKREFVDLIVWINVKWSSVFLVFIKSSVYVNSGGLQHLTSQIIKFLKYIILYYTFE